MLRLGSLLLFNHKMKTIDILQAAQPYGDRFVNWLNFVLRWENVYNKAGDIIVENDPSDRGGATFAGVDQRSHPTFNFSNPSAKAVAGVYYSDYWAPSKAQQLPCPVGEVVANYAVNMGLGASSRLLQRAINALGGSVGVDGDIGPKTLAAAMCVDPEKLADKIEDLASDRYRSIVANNPSQSKFLKGWLNRNAALEKWWQAFT